MEAGITDYGGSVQEIADLTNLAPLSFFLGGKQG
jgi:hypothetical protein